MSNNVWTPGAPSKPGHFWVRYKRSGTKAVRLIQKRTDGSLYYAVGDLVVEAECFREQITHHLPLVEPPDPEL